MLDKRGHLLDTALSAQVKLGQLTDDQKKFVKVGTVTKTAYINSTLEDVVKVADAKIDQATFDKIANLVSDEIAIEDAMSMPKTAFMDLILRKIAEVAFTLDAEENKK